MNFLLIFFIILLLIIIIILSIFLTKHTKEENQIKENNKKIREENNQLYYEQNNLKNYLEQLNYQINIVANNNNHIKDISKKAFDDYNNVLENLYKEKELEYDKSIERLRNSYNNYQDEILMQIDSIKEDLNKISQTRASALQAQLKEEEIKNQQAFYCPQVAEDDLKDAKTLRDIEYKLNNPRILRMLIWTTFYQKPMNQVCANVLGAATAIKCGVYKITNQKNNLCYIGQSKDIATRWKNHAKAGLGIDTPAGNKLYKSMQEDGLENFSFELLEECTAADLNEKEKFYINLYQADDFGFNSTNGNN